MKKTFIVLSVLLIVGFFLRTFRLNQVPLYGDELTILQDVNSILHTGKDVTGKTFPLTFEMGAGRPGGYIYASVPFVAIFGESMAGVRGLSILSGLGIIILMYFLGKKLFSSRVGYIAATVSAFSPWLINLSRGGFEANFALLLALAGIVSYLYAKEKPVLYIFTTVSWGLVLFTYPTYKVVLPVFVVLFIAITGGIKKLFEGKSRNFVITAILIGLLLTGLAARESLVGSAESRFFNINVFSQEKLREQIIRKINYERSLPDLPGSISRIFHNRGVEYFNLLKKSYLDNFSIDYLFISGDGNPRHNMTQSGGLYFVEMGLLVLGWIYLIAKSKKKEILLLGGWLLVAPVATALLLSPHFLRNAFMIPPLIFLSALGINLLIDIKNKHLKRIALLSVLIVWLVQFIFMFEQLYFVSPKQFISFWSYSAKRATELAIENKDKYDYIILSDRISDVEYAYPVYAKIDPTEVIEKNSNKKMLASREFKEYGNVLIGPVTYGHDANQLLDSINGSFLLIDNYENGLKDVGHAEAINAPDSYPSLLLITR